MSHTKINLLVAGVLVVAILSGVAFVVSESSAKKANCGGAALPPMTVHAATIKHDQMACGAVSIYGYLRKVSDDKGDELYFLVPDEEFLRPRIEADTMTWVGVAVKFLPAEPFGKLREECLNEFVVVNGEVRPGTPVKLVVDERGFISRITKEGAVVCR